MVRQNRRVVVIGAGPGGLASAMLLARAGVDVSVLERRGVVGGRTSTIEADGFRFDMGPTFFHYPAILEEIYEACGYHLRDHVELRRLDPQYHLVFEGSGDLLATGDVERMKAEIARLSPGDEAGLETYLRENRAKFEAFKPILQRPFNRWTDLLDPKVWKAVPWLRPLSAVDGDLRRYFKDPRVRLAFSFQSKYLGMSPFKCPSLFTILSYLEYDFGVFHPVGGCGALSQSMADRARDMGVTIRLNEPVEELRFEGRRVVGVRTPGGDYPADAVVVNSDFAHSIPRMVPNELRRTWSDRKIQRSRYSCSTFMMYLGIEGRYDNLHHHTIFLSREYQQNVKDIEDRHVLSENPSFYVQNPCVTDRGLAPEGHSTLYCLAPVTHEHGNVDWSKQTAAYRELFMRQMEKIGIEGLEDRIRYEKILTPSLWREEMAIHRGATFNLAHNFRQMLHMRPRNRFNDLESLYLVGGGTHPGSGLPVIFESARISSKLLLDDLGVGEPKTETRRAVERPLAVAELA